ncbi:MAG: diguanylate cyclase [Alphaproteobacteria bacterium]|nr:diguanylate cyclase [Alphaproteobacteria bacterium]MBL6946079.1 diguanylate cyclase [Rhodospirillales bacterium]
MNRLANILIAGTDAKRADRLSEVLSENNCNALVCDEIDQFLSEAREGGTDLAIIDHESAGIDCFSLIVALRNQPESTGIPVVVWGAEESEELFERALAAGVDDVFVGEPRGDEIFLRFHPLMRLSTQLAELRRRTALARKFGVDIPRKPDLAIEKGPISILVCSDSGGTTDMIGSALGDGGIVTRSEQLFEARDALYDGQFDAAVVGVSVGDATEDVMEFCEEVRNNPRLFNLPIVLILEAGVEMNEADAMAQGASRILDGTHQTHGRIRYVLTNLGTRQRLRWRINEAIEGAKGDPIRDELTDAYTYEFLRNHLDVLTDESREWQRHLTVIFFSIVDSVAEIRAEFGDAAADNLTRKVSHWISGMVRLEDFAARHGDAEFCVTLPDTPLAEGEFVMRRVAGILGYTDFAVDDVFRPITISVSVGAAELEADDDPTALIARARQYLE